MSRYRKIDPRIWNDEKFRALPDDGQLAFIFVLTHPHMTALGAMRGTIEGLASERGWAPKRMRDAIAGPIRDGMLVVNEKAAFVGAPNFLRYNEPEGPNSVTKAWIEARDLVPECAEKSQLNTRCNKYLRGKSDAFQRAIGDAIWLAFPDPCPIQEQEQEQEKDSLSDLSPSASSLPVGDAEDPARSSIAGRHRLPTIWPLTDELRKIATNLGCREPERMHAAFLDYWHGTGKPMLDWIATYRRWARDGHNGTHGKACACLKGRPTPVRNVTPRPDGWAKEANDA